MTIREAATKAIVTLKPVPLKFWGVGNYNALPDNTEPRIDGKDIRCAAILLGELDKPTMDAIYITNLPSLINVNDKGTINGGRDYIYKQKTSKGRVIAFLKDIEKGIYDNYHWGVNPRTPKARRKPTRNSNGLGVP